MKFLIWPAWQLLHQMKNWHLCTCYCPSIIPWLEDPWLQQHLSPMLELEYVPLLGRSFWVLLSCHSGSLSHLDNSYSLPKEVLETSIPGCETLELALDPSTLFLLTNPPPAL